MITLVQTTEGRISDYFSIGYRRKDQLLPQYRLQEEGLPQYRQKEEGLVITLAQTTGRRISDYLSIGYRRKDQLLPQYRLQEEGLVINSVQATGGRIYSDYLSITTGGRIMITLVQTKGERISDFLCIGYRRKDQ